jgi:integrase
MRETNKLKAVQVDAAIAASADNDNTMKLSDGESLYLVARRGFGYWSYQYRDPATGMLKTKGLGPYDRVTLKRARQLRDEVAVTNRQARRALKAGATLPALFVTRARAVAGAAVQGTFAEAAAQYIRDHANEWKPAERDRRGGYFGVGGKLTVKSMSLILDKPCADITLEMVAEVLRPIWRGPSVKPGFLVRSMIERVLSAASVKQRKPGSPAYANPALWKGNLEHFLSKTTPVSKHHAAMSYAGVPEFMCSCDDPVLRFLILTATRRGEVIGDTDGKAPMDWEEIDLAKREWTIPATRMKNTKPHTVPLSDAAMACLGSVMAPSGPVFAGSAKQLTHRLTKLLKGRSVTLHGFRSSFRDWAAECTDFPSEIVEMCLAHTVGTKVERAYRRTDLLAKRRALMEAWASYTLGFERPFAPQSAFHALRRGHEAPAHSFDRCRTPS